MTPLVPRLFLTIGSNGSEKVWSMIHKGYVTNGPERGSMRFSNKACCLLRARDVDCRVA